MVYLSIFEWMASSTTLQFPQDTLQQFASSSQGSYDQVRAVKRLQPVDPRTFPSQVAARAPTQAPVLAVGEVTHQAGRRLEGSR